MTKCCELCRKQTRKRNKRYYGRRKLGLKGKARDEYLQKQRIYYDKNKAKIAAQRKQRRESNPELKGHSRQRDRDYRAANLEELKAKGRERNRRNYWKDPEKKCAKTRQYQRDNPEKVKSQAMKRYHRRKMHELTGAAVELGLLLSGDE